MGDTFRLGGMLLGASSAATQVEGGDRNNNWYDWYRHGNIKDGSDPSVATMHWEHWQEDAELMAAMGLQCARLGLEWSRIEPERPTHRGFEQCQSVTIGFIPRSPGSFTSPT